MSRRTLALLAGAVVLRMAFHAVYLPAFEGPDEPLHLARILDFARKPWREALSSRWVDADIVASVISYPCPRPEHGCPPYGRLPGAFNLLREAPAPTLRPVHRIPNEEAKQPPFFYAAAGLGRSAVGARGSPAETLLAVRLFNVLLVALALFGPLRSVFGSSPDVAGAGLVALLTPGACEAFARCSNDAAVFLWSSLVILALQRDVRGGMLVALLAAGPLIKLTALAVCAYAVVVLWTERRPRAALWGTLVSIGTLPLRGWRGWGLSLESRNSDHAAISDSAWQWIGGVARSAYGVVKGPFWAGGWHNFRVPFALVALYGALLVAVLLASRIVRTRRIVPFAAGALVALAGTVAYGVSIRRSLGVWGGLASWYVWEWAPWLTSAAADVLRIERRSARLLFAAECVLVVAANVWWFARAGAVYAG